MATSWGPSMEWVELVNKAIYKVKTEICFNISVSILNSLKHRKRLILSLIVVSFYYMIVDFSDKT